MTEQRGSKIVSLDLSRSVAIVLAMSAHVLTTAGATPYILEHMALLMYLVRTSTPMFIVLFGVILEVVYRRRAERDGVKAVTVRFVERALLCWLLYVLASIPLLLTGKLGLLRFVATAALIGSTPFTDILRYYTILFVIAPFILLIRLRWGSILLLIATSGLMILHPLIAAIPELRLPIGQGIAILIIDLLIGVGDGTTGPSVLHSLFFVAVGITIGTALVLRRSSDEVSGRSTIMLSLLITFLAAGSLASMWVGPEGVSLSTIADKTLRNGNHPFYFFNGALFSTVIITLLRGVRSEGSGPLRATMLGQRSLFTFSFGNALLYGIWGSVTPFMKNLPFHVQLICSAVMLTVVFACSAIYDLVEPRAALDSRHPVRRSWSKLLHLIIDPPNHAIREFATWMVSIGSGLIGHRQKITMAARATVEKKAFGRRS